jgi:translation initiation factor 1
MAAGGKIPMDGGGELKQSPFGALGSVAVRPGNGPLPAGPGAVKGVPPPLPKVPAKDRGRVDLLRETGGRGGKTVTVVTGFTGIGLPEKEQLARKMRAACGCGGTVKDGRIEIQGDQRETVARILAEAGFRPVFAGG